MSGLLKSTVVPVVVGNVPPVQLAWLVQLPEALPPATLVHVNVDGTTAANTTLAKTTVKSVLVLVLRLTN